MDKFGGVITSYSIHYTKLYEEATAHIKHPSGRLRIDVPAAFGRQRILPLLLKITQDYPSLTFTITFSERFVDVIEEGRITSYNVCYTKLLRHRPGF